VVFDEAIANVVGVVDDLREIIWRKVTSKNSNC
jgi:hypothetical protein